MIYYYLYYKLKVYSRLLQTMRLRWHKCNLPVEPGQCRL